jgi:pimeloyl-ACP methyl ester carboxylesterase
MIEFSVKIVFASIAAWLFIGCNPGSRPEDDFLQYDAKQYERVSINYEVEGKGDTAVVFIHGWNLDHHYWDSIVNHLNPRYRTLSLDLAGHGDSGKDRISWTAESFGRDIAGIISKEGLKQVVLVGHSLGGEVALEVFQLNPDPIIGIIGIDNFKDVGFTVTPALETELKEYINRFKRNYSEMADSFARENIRSTNRDVINRIVKDYKSADPKIALAIFKNMVPKYAGAKNILQTLPFKLRIIASDYEPVNEDALKRYAKNGYLIEWVHDAGHFPMVEQPDQFSAAMDKMLSDLRKPHL